MKRFFTTSFIALAPFVGAAGVAPAAHAAGCVAPDGSEGTLTATGCVSDTAAALPDPSANSIPNNNIGPDTPAQLSGVMSYIAQLFAWLLGVAAITLDNTVYYTVVNMGTYVSNLSAVGVTWRILRDIGNIALIFGFLAIGISIILNTERMGYGKKMLPTLIVVAVFLNFSLFISEAVIDTGNIFATQFYTQINGGDPAGVTSIGPSSINREGISNAIMTNLGLQTVYGQVRDPAK